MGRIQLTDRLLELALEIIYLLSGEEYMVVKRGAHCCSLHVSEGSVKTQNLANEQKILQLTNKIIRLLSGEVPLRCDDVAVYFTVEEWEYVEGHRELYRNITAEKENCQPVSSVGPGFTKPVHHARGPLTPWGPIHREAAEDGPAYRNPPQGCAAAVHSLNRRQEEKDDLKRRKKGAKCLKINEPRRTAGRGLEEKGDISHIGIHTQEQCNRESSHGEGGNSTGVYAPADSTQMEYTSVLIKEETDSRGGVMCPPVEHRQPEHAPTHMGDRDRAKQDKSTGSSANISNASPSANPQVTQAPENVYKCPECQRCYSTHSDLVKHQRIHRVKKRPCPVCGKMFPCNYHLLVHQRTHTGEKPYTCSECGASFTAKSSLVTHRRTHTGEKPFGCCVCGKRFSRRSQLTKHQSVHAQEKTISCTKCGNCFQC